MQSSSFQILASRGFPSWLAQNRLSLALTTYQTGKLFFVGLKSEDRLSIFERTFNRAMGLWSDGQTIWLAAAFQLWRLENVLAPNELDNDYDRLYVPRAGFTTGDIDVHDIAVAEDGEPVFVSTLFSCLGRLDRRLSLAPLWKPPFVSRIAAEDRCHLNGLAMHKGQPRFVTACARSDVADGWRDHRTAGGCVVDVESGEIVCDGLSMPHSPRLYRNRLWVLDSGTGYFGFVDRATGRFEKVTFCPGYARGLAFFEDFAIVGVSRPRNEPTFTGLPLDSNLAERNAVARSGLQIVHLETGDIVQWLRIEGVVEELYDVVALPNVLRPKALGFKTDEIRHNVWIHDDSGQRNRWTARDRE